MSSKGSVKNALSYLHALKNLLDAFLFLMMQRFRSASLRFKIAFLTVVLLTGTSLALCIITIQIMNNYILNEIIKRGESVGKSIAVSAGYSLLSNDLLGLDNLVHKAKASNSDMPYVIIVDRSMKAIAHSDAPFIGQKILTSRGQLIRRAEGGTVIRELPNFSDTIFEISCPVIFMKKNLGSVIVGMNRTVLVEAQKKVINRILIVFGIIVLLGIFASSLHASFLIKPIRELSEGVDELKRGTSQRKLRIYSHDELGRLTRNFNEMSAVIAEQKGKLKKYASDLEEAYVSIVKVVAAAIDARDSYTHGHSARVAQWSVLIGRQIGLANDELTDLEVACLFHDVGKIKIPDSILLKPGSLTQDEYREMMMHVEHGASILSWAPSLAKKQILPVPFSYSLGVMPLTGIYLTSHDSASLPKNVSSGIPCPPTRRGRAFA
jgi:HAMP domain-containing protein